MKIAGLMVVGRGEADRYLEASLNELERLCDDAIICLNDVDKKTKDLVKQYRFWTYEDDREWGKEQPNIKTDLLKRIGKLKPDWIVALDADELLPTVTRETLETLTVGKHSCYFHVINLWNDEQHYRRALSFWNIRFFKYLPEMGLQYLKKPVHCGLAPPYFYKYGTYVPHIMRHYGLMKRGDRLTKVERYQIYDPRAVHKGREYYEALETDTTGTVYNETKMLKELDNYCKALNQKTYE